MTHYQVSGMNCAACSAHVEKAALSVEGITACSVNLLTGRMEAEGTADPSQVIEAVKHAGYGCILLDKNANQSNVPVSSNHSPSFRELKVRLIISVILLLPFMYITMGHMMLHWPVPAFLAGNSMGIGLLEMLFAGTIMLINKRFFISGFRGIWLKSPNMDSLISLGSSVSFVYSVVRLFKMTCTQNPDQSMQICHNLYFESAAMILVLLSVGKLLETKAKGRTTNALEKLLKLAPATATVLQDGKELIVPVDTLKINDNFIIKAGDNIPVDGIIVEGTASFDASALTGESMPVEKGPDDEVFSGTICRTGYVKCRASKVGQDTTLNQIISMVNEATSTKAPIAKLADRVAGIFVPVVMTIALIVALIWLIIGKDLGFSLARSISVLVISCPCALGLATPVAVMVGSGVGAKYGILFKTAEALEQTGKVETVVFDKTGTVTLGKPVVTDIWLADSSFRSQFLTVSCSLESKSEHPLAKAILEYAKDHGIIPVDVLNYQTSIGCGVEGFVDNQHIFCGNTKYIESIIHLSDEAEAAAQRFSEAGQTPIFVVADSCLLGIYALSDALRTDSSESVNELHQMGIHVALLTGDNQQVANEVGNKINADEIIAQVLPGEKESEIKRLKKTQFTMMVGDGINDALALMRSDIGVAIGTGSDIAIDSAQVILMNSNVRDVPAAIRLSRAVIRNIKQNLFWAFAYNCICIPLAAGAFIGLFGWEMNPMIGAAAMSISSICVVSNSLRLNHLNLYDSAHDHKIVHHKRRKKLMEKTLKIEGMMCMHCEAHVKSALEALPEVTEAVVSHEAGTAVIHMDTDIPDSVLKETVEKAGYKVL